MLLTGVLFSIISAFISIDSTENWFARSGAILSFVWIVVQFILSNLRKAEVEALFNSDMAIKDKFQAVKKKNPKHEFLFVASGVLGFLGTIIWGYGDLLF